MAELCIRDLHKSFGDQSVLDGVSFTVGDGQFCVLLGPSGCGKTTLLRIIAGLERHDGGSLKFGDEDVGDLSPRQRDVAMVFQSYALYPHMTVAQNLGFPLAARSLPRREIERRVSEAAKLLGIEKLLDRKPRALSGGQRQRVAIGRAIVREPRVFLFDEPLSNLDAGLRSEMRQELARLHRELGTTILYVTHDQVEAMTLGQTIVLLDQGRVQQQGTPEELYRLPANLFVARFIGSPAMNCIKGTLEADNNRMRFRSSDLEFEIDAEAIPESVHGLEVTLGIRPEAIAPGSGDVVGRLVYLEDLGAEVILHVEVGTTEIVARANRGWRSRIDDEVELSIDRSAIHLFRGSRRLE